MTMRTKSIAVILATIALAAPSAPADWPAYRAGNGRTAATDAKLATPLHVAWSARPVGEPRPAWPAPARASLWQNLAHIEPRVVDDTAVHPVVAGNDIYLASSEQDRLVCLDASTGTERWSFVTDGPLRYAPAVDAERVYLGGDDGIVRCLARADGKLIWSHRIGPGDDRIAGNGRIISAFPIRTGVLVAGGRVYATAGLYPSQGVYAVALDAATGELVWRRRLDDSPQGYLLSGGAGDDRLYVPTGRSNPIALALADGKMLGRFGGVGGTFALVADANLIAGRGNDASLTESDGRSRKTIAQFPGRHMAVTPTRSFVATDTQLTAIDRATRKPEWKQTLDRKPLAMIVAGDHVVLGYEGLVELRSASDGAAAWSAAIEGEARSLAAVDDRLIVTTDRGVVMCFASKKLPDADPIASVAADIERSDKAAAIAAAAVAPGSRGYALVLGADQADLAIAIARGSAMTVVVIDRDAAAVEALRAALTPSGLYGHRIAVHHVPAGDDLPFTGDLFNVIVSGHGFEGRTVAGFDKIEIERVLRPWGGSLWVDAKGPAITRGPLDGAGEWTQQYANAANTANSGDAKIARDLRLQWFGGPGPSTMVDRHLRAPAPLAAHGLIIVPGENMLIGVDACNGTRLWSRDLPKSQRYSMPFDAGYMSLARASLAVAVNEELWLIDPQSGEVERRVPSPRPGRHVGYVAHHGEALVVSTQLPTASRTEPSRKQIDDDYRNRVQAVTSLSLHALAPDGAARWTHEGGAILNPTITLSGGSVWFIESRAKRNVEHGSGRIEWSRMLNEESSLVCLDAATGAARYRAALDPAIAACDNIVYLMHAHGLLVAVGSRYEDAAKDTAWSIVAMDPATGAVRWRASHMEGKRAEFTHGEQVHHPVAMDDGTLVAEPMLYKIATGEPITLDGGEAPTRIKRPGHSCGTMSAAGTLVFFRANNPTLMELCEQPPASGGRFRTLAPTRPGCWINIIPANGLVLIPEASASCVCHYALQTSMAFRPGAPPVMLEDAGP